MAENGFSRPRSQSPTRRSRNVMSTTNNTYQQSQQRQQQQHQALTGAARTIPAPVPVASSSHTAVGFGPQHGIRSNQGDAQNDDDDDDGDEIDLAQVKLDAANDAVAMGIFVALGFFTLLFATAMGLVILLVSQYGLVAWISVASLCFTLMGGGILTYKYITKEKKMRKAHKHIVYWREVAREVIVNEIHNFQDEMNQHLYITDGSEYDRNEDENHYNVGQQQQEDRNPSNTTTAEYGDNNDNKNNLRQLPSAGSRASTKSSDSKRSKSVLFGLIKPFLSKKGKQQQQQSSNGKGGKSKSRRTKKNDPATFSTQGT